MTQIAHVDMLVANAERSLEFYVGVLGCVVVEDSVVRLPSIGVLTGGATDRVRIILLKLPGPGVKKSTIELMELQGGAVPIRFGSREATLPSLWSFSLVVDQLEPFLAGLAEHGVEPVAPIDVVSMSRAGTCRIAFVRDPDGNLIELIDVPRRGPEAAPET